MIVFKRHEALKKAAPSTFTKLEQFLNQTTPRMVRLLVSTWKDQQTAITYKELREAILQGEISTSYLSDWREQYSLLVVKEMAPSWEASIKQAADMVKVKFGQQALDRTLPVLDEYLSTQTGQFITNIAEGQMEAIRAMVRRAALTGDFTSDELARMIRPTIGLTRGDSHRVMSFYETLRRGDKDGKGKVSPKKAREMQMRFADKLHRQRAKTIADYEMASAYTGATHTAMKQAQRDGWIGKTNKRWMTEGTERVCSVCAALNGCVVDIDQEFPINWSGAFNRLYPPIHPRCHCDIAYEVVHEPVTAGPGEMLVTHEDLERLENE